MSEARTPFSYSATLSERDFSLISGLAYDAFGVYFHAGKRYLLESRLLALLKLYRLKTFAQLYEYLKSDQTKDSLLVLIDALSTNFTYFYREPKHFTTLEERVVPEYIARSFPEEKVLRVWSAGCSSGEEPYTIAMVLDNLALYSGHNYEIKILATDISVTALDKARQGVYPEGQLAKLPGPFKRRYTAQKQGGLFEIDGNIKKKIHFKRLNLNRPVFPFNKKFHVLFCRNVMIYFDETSRFELVKKFASHLAPGGYLFIGHSESIPKESPYFEYSSPSVYRKR